MTIPKGMGGVKVKPIDRSFFSYLSMGLVGPVKYHPNMDNVKRTIFTTKCHSHDKLSNTDAQPHGFCGYRLSSPNAI